MKIGILTALIIVAGCSDLHGQNQKTNNMNSSTTYKYTNNLIKETSPYLLQHAHNPVNWYTWSNKAFETARLENKLVLISIGYAACHWCHVMEYESFEDEEIARFMNDHFICIKVDREERPDIDQVYMSAVQILTGSGGWPLNCFALHDGRPIYGGTYFQPKQWIQVLQGLTKTQKENPQRILDAANEIAEGTKSQDLFSAKKDVTEFSKSQLTMMFANWKPYFDSDWGGNKQAPKFPLPISQEFMLQYSYFNNSNEANNQIHLTLTKMAHGGIYDAVGGGFARYSIDERWKVPHFEKMLYDNGQLVSLYAKAYKQNNNPLYKHVIEQSLKFIKREMTSSEGAFYSSYDADSEGIEGKFYVWNKTEILNLLGKDADWFCEYYNITEKGNWEGSNILWTTNSNQVIEKYHLNSMQFQSNLDKLLTKLLKERNKRISPALDDKILTAWNALMSIAYLDAFEALGDTNYQKIAINNGLFIKQKMLNNDGSLHRNYKNNKSNIPAFLDDYALSIQLFTKLYQNTFDHNWLNHAKALSEYVINHFYHQQSGMFFYTSDINQELIVRKMEVTDNVIPASNSIMANNLFDIGVITSNYEWLNIAEQMLANVIKEAEQNATYYANWGILLNKIVQNQYEVVIVGQNANELAQAFSENYLPNVIIAGSNSNTNSKLPLLENRWVEGETFIYICQNKACKLPVKTVNEALKLINKF